MGSNRCDKGSPFHTEGPTTENSLKVSSTLSKKQTKESWRCVDCHSVPCFKVDLFQSNLYSVLDFTTSYIFKFISLLKNTYVSHHVRLHAFVRLSTYLCVCLPDSLSAGELSSVYISTHKINLTEQVITASHFVQIFRSGTWWKLGCRWVQTIWNHAFDRFNTLFQACTIRSSIRPLQELNSWFIDDPSTQNQSQVEKFGFKILSKNHIEGIFPNW